MARNLLSVNQASFETDLTGWQGAGSGVAVPNMLLSDDQATITASTPGDDVLVAGPLSGWARWSAGQAFARDHTNARHGTSSLVLGRTDGNTVNASQATPTAGTGAYHFPVVPGRVYSDVASWFSATGVDYQLGRGYLDAATVSLSEISQRAALPAGEWADRVLTSVAPPGAVVTRLLWASWPAGGVTNLDRAGIFDRGEFVWSLPSAGGPNMLTDQQASIEEGPTTPSQSIPGWLAWTTTRVERSEEHALVGGSSMKITRDTGTATVALSDDVGTVNGADISVTPGQRYWISAAFYSDTARTAQARVQCFDANGVLVPAGGDYRETSSVPVIAGQWTRALHEFVVPEGAAVMRPMVGMAAMTLTAPVWVDAVQVEVAPPLPPYSLPTETGQSMTRVAATTAPDGGHVMALTRNVEQGPVNAHTTTFPAVVGTTYTAMADVQAPIGRLAGVQLEILDAGGVVLDSQRMAVSGTDTWETTRTSAVAGTGAATVRLRVIGGDFLPGDVLQVDRAGLFDGPAVAWAPGGQTAPALFITLLDPNRHRVGVSLIGLESDDPVYVDRILPDGRIERVRNAQGLEPAGGGVFFDDYDTPTDAGFRYRATQGGVVVATSDVVTLPSNGRFFLMDPNLPMSALPVIPAANAIPEWQRTAPVGVYRVLGRQDPIVVTDVRWWAEGEFTCYTLTAAQRDAFGQLSAQGLTIGLYGPAEVLGGIGRIYLVGSQVGERRVSPRGTEQAREWHMQVTQVAQPTEVPRTTPIVAWSDVVAAYATWQDVIDNETDWTDVMTGVPGAEGTGPDVGWEW